MRGDWRKGLESELRTASRGAAVRIPARGYAWNPDFGLALARALSGVYRGAGASRAHVPAPTRSELVRVLGPLELETQRVIRERIILRHALNLVITEIEQTQGPQALQPLIQVEDDGDERIHQFLDSGRPPIITTWHIGPRPGVWAFLSRFSLPLLKLQFTEWKTVPPGWTLMPGPSDAMQGAAILRRLRKHLAAGGWAAFAFDKTHRGTRVHRVPLFGREVTVKSAIGAVSQMSGAPVVLISTRWNDAGNRIRVKVHDPLFPETADEADERRMVETLTKKMEAHVRAYPWEQHDVRYRRILSFPRWEAARQADAPSPADAAE